MKKERKEIRDDGKQKQGDGRKERNVKEKYKKREKNERR